MQGETEMGLFCRMTSAQVDAVYAYARALYEGKTPLPDGIESLGDDIERIIENMILMKGVLCVVDYNSVDAVRREFSVIHPGFFEAALEYQPTSRNVH